MDNTERAILVVETFEAGCNKAQSFTIENIIPDIRAALDEKDAEIDKLRKDCLMMVDRLFMITRLDKTPMYDYGMENACGELPQAGECWKTPKELAEGIIKSISERVRSVDFYKDKEC